MGGFEKGYYGGCFFGGELWRFTAAIYEARRGGLERGWDMASSSGTWNQYIVVIMAGRVRFSIAYADWVESCRSNRRFGGDVSLQL